ncbi:TIGR02452 family protein [Singulisphaera rosea]
MRRSTRAEVARETVDIVERGSYRSASGRIVDIAIPIRNCLEATSYYRPEDLERLRGEVLDDPVVDRSTVFEVVNETTLSGISRLLSLGQGPVAALNFASAKNPGGGFLNGSHAQEESLARSSALYASQMRSWEFYEHHRASSSLLYSDAMILSPGCPIFRDDDGKLLDEPQLAAFITSAAPNAGAAADNRPAELPSIPGVFRRRSEYVLALAASRGYRQLVLGAWGCGVFRNDPNVVAESFASHLCHGRCSSQFDRIVFSVLDTTPSQSTLAAFRRALSGGE